MPSPTPRSVLFATPPSAASTGADDESDSDITVELNQTATPYPTSTPYPTATAYPTATPHPVAVGSGEQTSGPGPSVPEVTIVAPQAGPTIRIAIPKKSEVKHPKADTAINSLVERVESGEITEEEAASEAPLHRGDSVGVIILLSGNVDGVVAFLEANGASNINAGEDYIEAFVPVLLLGQTSEQPGVLRVDQIQPPGETQGTPQVTGQGPGVHGSGAWNDAGYSGQGIKVGVIDRGFSGFSDIMGTEVPARVEARCYTWLGQHSQNLSDCSDGGTHGTIVSESVIDIAPESTFYISDPQSLSELRDAVDWMISEGVSVINHSRLWTFDGPGDGTSPLSISPLNSIDRAVAASIVWVNAAGNQATGTWFQHGPFDYTTETIDGEEIRFLRFSGSEIRNRDSYIGGRLELRWDDEWGGADTDLDLFALARGTDVIALQGIDLQTGEAWHNPYESVRSLATFDILVAHRGGPDPDWIQLVGWGQTSLTLNSSGAGSIINPAESANRGMLAVGAAPWYDVNILSGFSSRGPTPDGRIKPDLVAANCGETATEGQGFCGTSQASPHVAGMAALVRQRFPNYSPAQVRVLPEGQRRAADQRSRPQNTWGHGFFVLPPETQLPQPPVTVPGAPSVTSVTPGTGSLTVAWRAPLQPGGAAVTAYDLRHIRGDASSKADSNWTVVRRVWSGAGALSYTLAGLTSSTRYDVQVRAVNAAGEGQWSPTVTGTPTQATPCATGGTVANAANNPGLVSDCDTLLELRDTLAGAGVLNWSGNTSIANWDGITVGGTPQRVILVYLNHQGLTGILPPELGNLTGLTQLTLLDNKLTGPIPSELANLSQLTHIFLGDNQLSGPIPSELGRMTKLQGLEIYGNRLTGTIPAELAGLTNLQGLHIDNNQLTGTIPAELGRLSSLRWLALHDNLLTGEIPAELGRLTNLQQLYLSGNRFSGCVPMELRGVSETDRTHLLKDIGIPYCDVLLSGLRITSGTLSPQFDAYVTDYRAAARASRITVSPSSRHNATFEYLEGDDNVLADADGAQAGYQVDAPATMATTIRIKVTSSDGKANRTYTIQLTGPDALGAPEAHQVTAGTNSLTVSWTAPSSDGGSSITAYDLRHIRSDATNKGDANWAVVQDAWTGSGARSYELADLDGGTQYDVQVRAVNSTGDGPWSVTATGIPTTEQSAPGSPANAQYVRVGTTTVVTWEPSAGATHYKVYFDDFFDSNCRLSSGRPSFCELLAGNVTGITYTHANPDDDTNYYWITACNSAGCSDIDSGNPAQFIATQSAPDLVVDRPTVSVCAPEAGARFTLNAAVRNQGNGPSAFTTLRYYRSTDSAITTSDTEVGTDSVSRINALETGDESVSLTAPDTPGTYYYGACVDAVSDESDTANNCSAEVAVTVGAAPAPDLVVDRPTVSVSAPEAGARFTLNAAVRNQGNGPSAFTTLRYYRSTDSAITTSDTEVGTDSVSRINALETGDESVSLTAPDTPGTYYYGACVDAVSDKSDTANNCSAEVAVTVGAAPAPDLVVETPVLSNPSPVAGVSFPMSVTVRNQGNGRSDSTVLRYYRSTDATITTSDTVVGTSQVGSLTTSETNGVSTVLPGLSAAGTYYYGACVDAVSGESDTTNNCSSAVVVTVTAPSSNPDLVVDMGGGISTSVAGTSFSINLAVRNQGTGATSASTTLRYYRSTDAVISDGDTEVGTDSVGPLAGSSSISGYSIDLTAPSTKGTYYYGACVDAVADETVTTNNCSSARTITIGSLGPDLVVTQVNGPTMDPIAEEDFWISIHVENQGDSLALSPTARFYRSTDTTISSSDTEIGNVQLLHMEPSRAFDSGSIKTLAVAPSTAGTYYYGACIDPLTGESDTTNNCSSAEAVTVHSASGSDLAIERFWISAIEVYFPAIPMYATVRNQGTGPAASTPVSFYLSTDATISTTDTRIDGQYVKRLAPSETSGYGSVQVTTTAEPIPGTYYYGACVEPVSGETDTTNNCSTAVAVTVGDVDTAPGAPTGLTATADGQTEIDLSWSAPADDGGAAITGYRIEVSTDGSSWSDQVTDTNSTSTSYSHSGLSAGSTRHYRVSAINSEGTGPASNVANATTDSSATQPGGTSGCATDGAVPDASNNPGLVSDCEALLDAKDTLRGTAGLNWSAGTSISQWDGITVGGTPRRVTKLDTSGAGLAELTGTIPRELGNLTGLTDLRLSNNKLTGVIPPELGNLANLESLSVWNSELSGAIPAELGNLSNLTFLRLNWNQLTGPIPPELGNLSKLDSLYLGGNRLTRAIPPELGRLTNLQHLLLGGSSSGGNRLTGVVPSDLSNLTKLQSLDLWNNQLTGQIPTWLGSRAGMTTLNLAGNQFTGTIPTELGNLTQVNQLWLQDNQLTGTIPAELGNLTNVKELHLDNNRLSGEIPAALANLSGLRQLFLANSQLTGCIPAGLRDVAGQHDIGQLGLPDCTTAATKPGKPTGLSATADGQTEIDLSWTAPSDDGGADITGYRIEVSTNGTSWGDLEEDTDSTSTSYTHSGLTAGSTRHYRVSSINSAGIGPASDSDSATTDAATKPGKPTGLTATADGQTEIDLSWTAPSDDGGAYITGYRIEVSTDGSSWSDLVADTDSTGTSYSHSGLTAGSTRHYRVSAINSAGTGPASDSDSATTDAAPAQATTCSVDLVVSPGESCTYPGQSDEFSVDSTGRGSFLFTTAGERIDIRNTNINGVTYTLVAGKQSDGTWKIEEVG